MALNDKQRVFVEEYLTCWNATEAARRAGYSELTARSQGQRLLTNVDIDAAIKARLAAKVMTADEVLVRLSEQARGVQSAYILPEGVVNMRQLVADGKAHLIKGIKETKYGKDIEFYDAQAALVHIGKHHKLFTEQVQHSGNVNTTDVAVYLPDNGRQDRN